MNLDVIDPWVRGCLERIERLSDREQQVFALLAQGLDNRSLARRLGIADRTAKRHLTQVMLKLGCESRLQVGLVALTARWLQAPAMPRAWVAPDVEAADAA